MATTKSIRAETAKGPASLRQRVLHVDDQGDGFRLPANLFAQLTEKNMAQLIGGGMTPNLSTTLVVPGFTVTTGGTGDVTGYSTTGGLVMTLASDDNFDMTLDSVLAVTPTTGKWYGMVARIQTSAVTGAGIKIGLTTGGGAAALPFGTNYTDVVAISKEIADASVVGTCRGNSGTAAASSEFGDMVNDTEVEVGFAFYLHATTPQGYWSYKTATAEKATITAFTSSQLTQVAAILTSPPTMYWTIHGTGVTATNPTITVTSFMAGGDR